MRFPRRPGVLLLASILLPALAPALSFAQLVRCSAVDEPGYKILLDDIIVDDGSSALPMLETLKGRLAQNLEQLSVETGLPIAVYRCKQRRPPDASVFGRPQVEQLHARQVVLEIWGSAGEVVDDAGERFHEAQIGYVLIPVRLRSFASGEPVSAFTVPRRADTLATIDALVRLVDQASVVPAYALLSAGTRLMGEGKFDAARTHLCRAAGLLQGSTSLTDKSLATFARAEAERALQSLKAAEPDLATLLPADACGGVS